MPRPKGGSFLLDAGSQLVSSPSGTVKDLAGALDLDIRLDPNVSPACVGFLQLEPETALRVLGRALKLDQRALNCKRLRR